MSVHLSRRQDTRLVRRRDEESGGVEVHVLDLSGRRECGDGVHTYKRRKKKLDAASEMMGRCTYDGVHVMVLEF